MNGSIVDLKDLLFGPPWGIIESGYRALSMAKFLDCTEQVAFSLDEQVIVSDCQGSDHAG